MTGFKDLPRKKQLQKNQARAKILLALMKNLSCTEWGADQKVLKKVYVGTIRPVLDYRMAASSTAARSNSSKLSRVQNRAMRMTTGAMWSNTHICYGDGHRPAASGRQTGNESTDTSCKVQKTPGPSDARTYEPANKGETKKVQLPTAQQDPRKEKL